MVDTDARVARDIRKAQGQESRAAHIRAAASELLDEVGISGLTMRAVAARAGYTAGAVYSYFASKEALLAAIALDALDQLAKAMRQEDETLSTQASICTQALDRVGPLLIAAHRGDVPEVTERALTGRIISILRQLDRGVGAGGARGDDASSQALDTIALWCGLVGLAQLSSSGRLASLEVEDIDVASALVARYS
ncbi:Transcriptional regulator, TetR family [Candidatus Phaeomarinobacter ectocarpi]|uniref:Transcriptional regulator, TetR family n=1 Tax=Candidatus Phaeomarinibacter ectocarpi TaxID=1458461 RepID=X5MDH8_9HYPH|nr:TetR/AcrR family transcriptional regulator [Candidatus Phaeomarinobacter ectocarpi]CDO60187.1 Transcriptional regulator, TetR family [Candidatus Phaeomarinobacter ectocarpi]